MKVTVKILLLLLVLTAFSCGSNKKVARSKEKKEQRIDEGTRMAVEEITGIPTREREILEAPKPKKYVDKISAYINTYAPIAQEEMKLYRIPASITLAQGILESGAGEGELTRRANNHFGIKCHGWKGGGVYHDDDRPQECFRKYNHPKYSYRDHSLFLTERKRYAALFELQPDDYKGWAKGLKAAGYATDRKYPDKLINLIERYELYKYDGQVLGKKGVAYQETKKEEVVEEPSAQQYVVKQGDTLYSIAKRYRLTVEQLKEYNNLRDNNIGIGQTLYVTP
jgi:flagellum-specific peptidoglycan hydrolase FlgJ